MRKRIALLLVPVLVLGLSGCSWLRLYGAVHDAFFSDTPEAALSWARSHKEELRRCGEELLGHYPDKPQWAGACFTVSVTDDGAVELWHELSGELICFSGEDCSVLLKESAIQDVQLEPDRVCFSLGGRGFGSQTDYFEVYYIPSDDISGCFGWSPDMTFTEQDGGWFGKTDDPNDDDTFFYQEIAAHLFFCVSHF